MDKLVLNLLLTLAAPNRQKWFWNHAGFAGGGAEPYEGGGVTVGVAVGKG